MPKLLTNTITLTVLCILALALSLIATYIWESAYNAPIVPTCPIGAGGTELGAADPDGVVTQATIIEGWVAGIRLENVQPAPGPGGLLTASLNVYNDELALEKSPKTYPMQITFANNNTPVAQTATCRVLVNVRKVRTQSGEIGLQYYIQRDDSGPEPAKVETITWRRAGWGLIPGLLVLLLAGSTLVGFVTPFYDLQSTWEGVQFLAVRLNDEGMREFELDDDHAAIVQAPASAPEVLVEPDTYVLSPFERVQSLVPLQPYADLEVEGLSRDHFPVRYTAKVAFEIPKEELDAIRQANTQGYLHHRRTPDEEVTESINYVRRALTGEVQDAVCAILSAHRLDELGSEEVQQELKHAANRALKAEAAKFGATARIVLEMPPDDPSEEEPTPTPPAVKFSGEELEAYLAHEATEMAEREEEAKRQSRKMYYDRKSEAHRRAQETLSAHVWTHLHAHARSEAGTPHTCDCLIQSVIETLQAPDLWEKIEADHRNALSRLKEQLTCAPPQDAKAGDEA